MAQPPPETPTNLVGQKLFGTYTITEKLGEGAMGDVYLARQAQTGQRLAIKLLNAEAQKHAETVQRFLREARVISMMTHPNIVRVFIFGQTSSGVSYMAMEHVDGRTLETLVVEGPLSEERTVDISRQILDAIAEAHELGIMHRDLKPENVLLTEFRGRRDYVKILDFGIAKVQNANQQLTQAGVVYGTPAYMSPEQAQALDDIDHRADIYALGCMMYEMATGRLPFDAKTALKLLEMQAFAEPERPSAVGPVSPKLEAVIMKAMQKDPAERYQTANDMLEALEALNGRSSAKPAGDADLPITFQSLNDLAATNAWVWPAVFGTVMFFALLSFILLIVIVAG